MVAYYGYIVSGIIFTLVFIIVIATIVNIVLSIKYLRESSEAITVSSLYIIRDHVFQAFLLQHNSPANTAPS